MVPNYCPGDDTIQCCVPGPTTPDPPSGGSGSGIVSAALKQKGLPYVWGGGGCSGPSQGGFDCSGLTQYAICQTLDKTIPRTAHTQYHSSMGKQIPRAEAKAGDLIFWAKGGDCANSVSHVGIFMRDGWMVNAARKGTPVREQSIWTSSDGTSICPKAFPNEIQEARSLCGLAWIIVVSGDRFKHLIILMSQFKFTGLQIWGYGAQAIGLSGDYAPSRSPGWDKSNVHYRSLPCAIA
ncbi:MAG: hypothetical protein Q9172_007487 [Xanthocarpia lactea]